MRSTLAFVALVACGPSPPPAPVNIAPPPKREMAEPAPEPPVERGLTATQRERAEELLAQFRKPGAKPKPLLEKMRNEVGGEGLVMALSAVPAEPPLERWYQTRLVFETIRDLADPDAADALVKWAGEAKVHAHWRGEAGLALAEIGDRRAVPLLVERLGKDPQDLYDKAKSWQNDSGGHLSRTDYPRIAAVRLLADLASVHPEHRAALREEAEAAVFAWMASKPMPHANGMRFLAAVGTTKHLPELRAWAFPTEPLPAPAAMPPFPMEFAIAQSASRYVGQLRDGDSLDDLLAQLRRKDPALDITQQALSAQPIAMRGMALRALAYGAASGLGAWGEAAGRNAALALMPFIEDRTWHEEARGAACRALAWVDADAANTVIDEVVRFGPSADEQERFIATCYARTLAERGAKDVEAMARALGGPLSFELREMLGLAIGRSRMTPRARELLVALVKAPPTSGAERVALLLGGTTPNDVAAALVGLEGPDHPITAGVGEDYWGALSYVSVEDLESGRLERWVRNARAAEAAGHPWVMRNLRDQLANLIFDQGPHSLTRVVARMRLYAQARSGSEGARLILEAMQEDGVLMALARSD